MLISNEYGRALVSPSLYRVSATETLYNIQSYAGKFSIHIQSFPELCFLYLSFTSRHQCNT